MAEEGFEDLSRTELKGKKAPRGSCQKEAFQKRERNWPNYTFLDIDLNLKFVNIM
jgi:hypothetical protein